MSSFRTVLSLAVLVAVASSVVSAAYVSPVVRDVVYPKCYKTGEECSYYGYKDIACCGRGASCVVYKEKGDGKYCLKYDDYYYYDGGRDESYCYSYDGKKVVRGKKDGEYYSWKDDYKVKVIYDEDYYKKLSKYYDDDGGKYWYSEAGEKKYVKEYVKDDGGATCFYDEYNAKVYDFFHYEYSGKTYCYGKGGRKHYVAGDEAYYYKDDVKKDEKVFITLSEIKEYYEDGEGVYKYTPSATSYGEKYYVIVYKPDLVEERKYYSKTKKIYFKPKVVAKTTYYEQKLSYGTNAIESKYDYNSHYYGKKKPGIVIPDKPIDSPEPVFGGSNGAPDFGFPAWN